MEKHASYLKILFFILFALLLALVIAIDVFADIANAELYQIPALSWEGAENCYDGKFAGKHYMRTSGDADGELRTLCMKAPVKLPSIVWDYKIATEIAHMINKKSDFPIVAYLEIKQINKEGGVMFVVISDAKTERKYNEFWIFVP